MVNKTKYTFSIKNRLWVVRNNHTFLGDGRVALLEKVKEHGSITEAAKSMKMSYKKAWQLINGMNMLSDRPLVIRSSGGKGGGGTLLTKHGERAIRQYRNLENRCNLFLSKEVNKMII